MKSNMFTVKMQVVLCLIEHCIAYISYRPFFGLKFELFCGLYDKEFQARKRASPLTRDWPPWRHLASFWVTGRHAYRELRQILYWTWCYKCMRCVATCNVLQHRCIATVSQHVLSHPDRKLALKVKYFCHNRKFNSRLQANSPRNLCAFSLTFKLRGQIK